MPYMIAVSLEMSDEPFVSVPVFGFGCLEHFVIGQGVGCGALVTVHPVCLVMGDFHKLIAELRKLIPQRRVKCLFFSWSVYEISIFFAFWYS